MGTEMRNASSSSWRCTSGLVLLPAVAQHLVGPAAEQGGIAAGAGDAMAALTIRGSPAVIDVAVEGLGLPADGVHRQIQGGYPGMNWPFTRMGVVMVLTSTC